MKITFELAEVMDCAASACTYNVGGACHARAITIGDGGHAMCDTFLITGSHCSGTPAHAGVGACKVSACRHNLDYECQAERIRVGSHESHADCLTFAAR
jgi:hypothetical protein